AAITRCPSAASRIANPCPSPRAAPVTRATLPLLFLLISMFSFNSVAHLASRNPRRMKRGPSQANAADPALPVRWCCPLEGAAEGRRGWSISERVAGDRGRHGQPLPLGGFVERGHVAGPCTVARCTHPADRAED